MSDPGLRAMSVLGFATMIAIAWCLSTDRRRFPWRTAAWGVGLQLGLGLLLLRSRIGHGFFTGVNDLVNHLLGYTQAGSQFLFGPLMETGFSFALGVLPIIVFMGSFF